MGGQRITFPANGGATPGYLAAPQTGKGPGVIVIQEWWGLVPHIQSVCNRLAGEGFLALAPDLYHGETTTSPDEAGRLMMALQIAQAEMDLRGAVRYLATHASASGRKVGVVGFCMGGQLAIFAASTNPDIAACIDFYGIHPHVQPDLARLAAPVLGFFGEQDEFVSPEAVHALERQLKDLGKTIDCTMFPGVGHAFFNDSRPDAYNHEAAGLAWQRMLQFFRHHLQP